jgi:integrase
MADREIRLEAKDTKDREPRTIPICNELYSILKSIPKAVHDNHVILFHGKSIKNISTCLESACKKAKIIYGKRVKDGFIFHDLRHSFNTYMRKAGVQESVIMEITGHSTREMFDRYNSIDGQDKKEAVRRFEVFLTNANQNANQGLIPENGSFANA